MIYLHNQLIDVIHFLWVSLGIQPVLWVASGDHRAGLRREETISSENVGGSHKPDICKDYKDTGYCGLASHDCGCYKVGWTYRKNGKINTAIGV